MGCKNSKTLQQEDDLEKADAAAAELASETDSGSGSGGVTCTSNEPNDDEDDIPVKTFGKGRRRDSVKYNKKAIEKRKKHNANLASGVETKDMPRAFMKPGETSTVIKKTGQRKGFGRRDSIALNKKMLEKKKKRNSGKSNKGTAPAGINVEIH
jgi:hypothetical protein